MSEHEQNTSDSSSPLPSDSEKKPHVNLSPTELRKRLIARCQEGEKKIKGAVEIFQKLSERTKQDRLTLTQELLGIVGEVLAAEDWSQSQFASKLIEPMATMRSDLLSLEQELLGKKSAKEAKAGGFLKPGIRADLSEDEVSVFILLYQVDGPNMRKWTAQLKNLSQSIVSRPIYATEKSVKRMLQARHNVATDAYVKVTIPQRLLMNQGDSKRHDRLGQPLLALTTNAIQSDAIDYFVYDKIAYYFRDEKLEKINHNE